ncbi:uncharacterized protein LOC124152409 [Haliotis rufescens]|uniref:uncharacterized protein LOC124152408 n=1 Tax=Haliotis rufescens TaxID=6454 RepID=UPI00201EF727|nr:uncharacterized protein LOC124152408 [Haliotis rufescens]XP_046381294.2 uncharacterized protein LOC124152409 [Haliotis rufescens]XP_046381295.2 uncharacterized protein LOC124152409 [Haliotis rufescens]
MASPWNKWWRLLCLGVSGIILIFIFHFLHYSRVIDPRVTPHHEARVIPDTQPMPTQVKMTHAPKLETGVYRWKQGKWVLIPGFCSAVNKFSSAQLRTPVGTIKMYIHNVKDDIHVSGSIQRSGMWESPGVNTMISILRDSADMGVLDLGSQLGTYSLTAALMGRRVVAVDPLVENVMRLCATAQEAKLADRITILFAALSDDYRTVTFKREKANIGGTVIKQVPNATFDINDNYNPDFISTVRLDDILQFVDFPKAFIKVDVENHEYEVLKEGKQLFSKIDIRDIMMEWFQIKRTPNGPKIRDFLVNKNFKPMTMSRVRTLSPASYITWPNDILWVKQ